MAIGTQIRELVESFSELTAQHIRLARVELAEDAKYLGARVGVIAALAPLILVGYGFLCAALAMGLASVVATWLALVIVGVLNLAVGLGGIALAARQLRGRQVMGETLTELEATSVEVLHRARIGPAPAPERQT